MQKIETITDLKNAIQQLEDKQSKEWPLLKEQFLTTYESLKPINLIKSTFSELTRAPDFKEGIGNTTFSLAAGYLSKKIVVGSTWNPLKQLFGTLFQMGVTSFVSNNVDEIKSIGDRMLKKIIKPQKPNG